MSSFASLLILSALPAHGQTPITSLPYVIAVPGAYVLASSLDYTPADGNAIQINASNVTLDLNGYYINNLTAGPSTKARGIVSFNRANVTVKNGFIVGFDYGVALAGDDGVLNTNGVVEDIRLLFTVDGGIVLSGSRNAIVRKCQISSTGYSSSLTLLNSTAIGILSSTSLGGNLIANDTVSKTSGTGILVGGFDLADDNSVVSAPTGIQGTDSTSKLKNNVVSDSTTAYSGGTQLSNNF